MNGSAAMPRHPLTPFAAHNGWALLVCLALSGCGSTVNRAPVEVRSTGPRAAGIPPGPVVAATPAATAPAAPPGSASPSRDSPGTKPLPGAENAGKPGYYTVKPGDTLLRIALENGQNWRDVARWSQIDNPNMIEVGQVLRILPPGVEPGAATTRPVASSGRVESRPMDAGGGSAASVASASSVPGGTAAPPAATGVGTASAPAPAGSAGVASAPAGTTAAAVRADEEPAWAWPASGPVLAGFDEARNVKGLSIGGKSGDAVLAAADGRVVYAGSGLRGYGNLVIVKHNNVYLTAYAHNQSLLVKEDQAVRKGQKIAEMGSTDAERVQLHFEIRRQGRPIDPARMLPPR